MVCQADGVELPRGEITEHAFVLGPLAEIAGDQIHPVLEKSIAQLWRDFVKDDRELEPVALSPLS
jgi:2-amino-4-hydroxy-6-hydroxymethyldihydropteridine diphosphokinase